MAPPTPARYRVEKMVLCNRIIFSLPWPKRLVRIHPGSRMTEMVEFDSSGGSVRVRTEKEEKRM